jgi:hypothetical protein
MVSSTSEEVGGGDGRARSERVEVRCRCTTRKQIDLA